ncbi:MAG: hypothetical protein ACD_72C00194G0002 [uncultured bacterium]|nr:MAG: hypothetical protein ACD_72C00194G0002 [uncultured bacterium]
MLISTSELIEQSLDTYVQTWRKFAPYIGVLAAIVIVRYGIGLGALFLNADTQLSSALIDTLTALLLLCLGIVGFWTSLIITKNSSLLKTNQPLANLKQSYRNTVHYIWPVILVSLLYALACLVGSFLLFVPGIIFAVWYYFANYIVVFEDQKVLESLKNSKKLILGRWWKMAFRFVIPKALLTIALAIVAIFFTALLNQVFKPSEVKYEMLTQIVNGLLAAITLPLFLWTDTLLYYNAKENPVQPTAPLQK